MQVGGDKRQRVAGAIKAEEDFDEEESEAAFMAALGTRPPLPDTVDLDNTYRLV